MASSARLAPLHVAVSGSTGLIGGGLVSLLTRTGHRVTRLVRGRAGTGEIAWSPTNRQLDPADLEGVDAVVHLAGENVGARWTSARKARIRDSRVQGTRLVSESIARLRRPPRVLVSASAIGIYGNRGDEILTEASEPGDASDFLVSVAREWEAAAEPARSAGVRVVHSRFGIVLSPKGGALKKMLPPFRLGLAGRLGPGSQWMSWISIDDAVAAIYHLLLTDSLNGPVNVTAPEPRTNADFTRALGRVLGRPTPFPVPAAALRIALGEMADGTILASTRALPTRLLESGFQFQQPDLDRALRHVLGMEHRSNFPG
jgi:uncharacterized protein (TIGR01777 family)